MKIADAYIAIKADGAGFSEEVGKVTTEAADKAQGGLAGLMSGPGGALTKTLTPVAATVAAVTGKIAGDWRGMVKEMAVQTGATGAELKGMESSVKSVAGSVVGSVGEIGNVISDLAAKTDLTGKPLEELTKNILSLNDLGIEVSGSSVAATFGAWGVEAENFNTELTRMFRVSQESGQPMGVLLDRLSEMRPRLQALGFDLNTSSLLVSRVTDAMAPGLAKAIGTVNKAQGDSAKTQLELAKAQKEYDAVLRKSGAGSEEAAVAAENLSEAQVAVSLTGKSAKDAFASMVSGVKNATTEQEALSLAIDYFGVKAGPAWLSAIRSGKLDLGALSAEVDKNTNTATEMSKKYEGFFGPLDRWREKLVALVGPHAQQAATFATIISGVGPVVTSIDKLGGAFGKVAPKAAGAMAKLGPAVSGGLAALAPILAAAMPWILIVAGIAIAAVLIWKFFKSELPGKIGAALKDAGKWLWDKGKDIIMGLLFGLFLGPVLIVKFFQSDLPGKIWDALKGAGKWLVEVGGDIIKGLWDGVISKVVGFYQFLYVELPKKIFEAFKGAGRWLFDIGKDIIMGLVNGIKNAAGRVLEAVKGIVDKIPGWIKGPLGIGSPSKVMAGFGANMMEGLALGISGAAGLPKGALGGALGALTVPAVTMSGGRLAATGGTAPITINLDLRNAVVGIDDLVDKVAAGLAERDRRVGTALR